MIKVFLHFLIITFVLVAGYGVSSGSPISGDIYVLNYIGQVAGARAIASQSYTIMPTVGRPISTVSSTGEVYSLKNNFWHDTKEKGVFHIAGDLNGNAVLDLADVVIAMRFFVNQKPAVDLNPDALADVNQTIDLTYPLFQLQKIAGARP